ncbi:DNA alkylation repair protein [Ureibacillus thermophilus]|uniref:DNA alkylation repair protein n=1 Tax=Ureibacillus thermophilus TaxID=367743 RepID=A0A4P6UV61_9BACL|nr:DNA alkylation repair protein [Ureibacillus thermophilus]QBK26131.1 DNA alkylation repair protein [Ureibacillus thermophilus]
MNIRSKLIELAETNYQRFQKSLIPNQENILGVRLPILRKLAKEISKGDWENFLRNGEEEYFEEIMLKGMVIGEVKLPLEERLSWVEWFVPKIDNWSVCDSFCTGLKFTKNHRKEVWKWLLPYFQSSREFEVRFAVVMLLCYFIEEEYLKEIFPILEKIKQDGYYVKMAVSWAISKAYIQFPAETTEFLHTNSLDDFTYNKALQKIIESRCLSKEKKEAIRKMKRN